MATPSILTYTEIAGRLDDIIGSLRDVRDKAENACSWRANDLDELSGDVERTHRTCPDVPVIADLAEQLTDTADRLRDRNRLAFDAREEEAQHLEGLRDGLRALAAERPEFDEFIQETRGDAPRPDVPATTATTTEEPADDAESESDPLDP